ncbi:TIGR02647 family protein [Vibrio sp. UCD-FRSSP16_10]|uniref:TIGR02647 family protein n=1 Tax=unclassified Vibrio TaxID=2614977 RepID=UPI000800015D|nr:MULTISPECIES: TIGR02647 family protein [unclassified Vibrio]OBT15949.1 TIGR02647 family protein [Vibrio sp. UCD-FRSSP16_10]OBT17843.1 TIGR02647 family protein [Vibrio sp. UCD-FRSSP16_30]
MKFNQLLVDELNLLMQFDLNSAATGIKVHSDAAENIQLAIKSLFDKGLCTLCDGGYLTEEGIQIAERADKILRALSH